MVAGSAYEKGLAVLVVAGGKDTVANRLPHFIFEDVPTGATMRVAFSRAFTDVVAFGGDFVSSLLFFGVGGVD